MTPQEAVTHLETIINWNEDISVPEIEAVKLAIEGLQFQQELVRCKDCKHWDLSMSYGYARMCEHWQDTMREYGYCSFGERRDEE